VDIINGPAIARIPKTIINFGTNVRVLSLIDVAAWNIPINRPTRRAVIKIGPVAKRTLISVSRPMVAYC
jgi:hypothetical protein